MSSIELQVLRSQYPTDQDLIDRLEAFFNSPNLGEDAEFTFDNIYNAAKPPTEEKLSLLVSELVSRGILRRKIHVESPATKGGVGTFEKLSEIPETIHDWRTDADFKPDLDDLRIVFSIK